MGKVNFICYLFDLKFDKLIFCKKKKKEKAKLSMYRSQNEHIAKVTTFKV